LTLVLEHHMKDSTGLTLVGLCWKRLPQGTVDQIHSLKHTVIILTEWVGNAITFDMIVFYTWFTHMQMLTECSDQNKGWLLTKQYKEK